MLTDREGKFLVVGALIGAVTNVAIQTATNLAANGGDLRSALRCIDWLDVGISAAIGSIGGSVGGSLGRAALGAINGGTVTKPLATAAGSAALGGYLKGAVTPVPLRVGDDCECKGKTGLGVALDAIGH